MPLDQIVLNCVTSQHSPGAFYIFGCDFGPNLLSTSNLVYCDRHIVFFAQKDMSNSYAWTMKDDFVVAHAEYTKKMKSFHELCRLLPQRHKLAKNMRVDGTLADRQRLLYSYFDVQNVEPYMLKNETVVGIVDQNGALRPLPQCGIEESAPQSSPI
jgi:hypothetical protein